MSPLEDIPQESDAAMSEFPRKFDDPLIEPDNSLPNNPLSGHEAEITQKASSEETEADSLEIPPISLERFSQWSVKPGIASFDYNQDGELDISEIDQAIIDPSITGEEAVYVNALKESYNGISGLDGENGSISKKDFKLMRQSFDSSMAIRSTPENLIRRLKYDFIFVDKNKDGWINRDELENAMNNQSWNNRQNLSLKSLDVYFNSVANASNDEWGKENDGVTESDLEEFPHETQKLVTDLSAWLDFGVQRLNHSRTNDGGNFHPNQGRAEDCTLLASLIAIQSTSPVHLNKLFDGISGNQTATTLPGIRSILKPVKPTETELIRYANDINANRMEKAVAQVYSTRNSVIPAETLSGLDLATTLKLLTGNPSYQRNTRTLSIRQLEESFKTAYDYNIPVVAGSYGDRYTKYAGIVPNHAHAARYVPATREIELTNPWPVNSLSEPRVPNGKPRDGKLDGIFRLSTKEFKAHFRKFGWSEPDNNTTARHK